MPHDPHPRIVDQHALDALGPPFRLMTGFADHYAAIEMTGSQEKSLFVTLFAVANRAEAESLPFVHSKIFRGRSAKKKICKYCK